MIDYNYENCSGESVYNKLTERAKKKFGELVKNIHHVDTRKSTQDNSLRIQGWISLQTFIAIMQQMNDPIQMSFKIQEDKVEILIWVIDEMYLR